ncbi:MAG TPA: NAD(P)(+) transhydrogenase (Re/Si-specific) subunit beta, partial [Allosphingosinicella sp.]|nr:NAD(P)(+) transhydrogenase (Re/Si-specific) subunit beta [Allosphingosinicella sp.]
MHEAASLPDWVALAYLVSGVCFILALRGLSSPVSSRRGNHFGIAGMVVAVGTTLIHYAPRTVDGLGFDGLPLIEIVIAIAIGGAIGLVTARRIAMTAMPQLVAAFHSLVGLAAVLVATAAFLNPGAFGIAELVAIVPVFVVDGLSAAPPVHAFPAPALEWIINPVSRVEMGLGAAIGAVTFSGSVIAFLKLNGNMSGAPILLPLRHVINLGTIALILGLIAYFTVDQSPWVFFTITGLSFLIGFLLIIPIGGADMPVVVSMLNSYSGWAAAAM